MPKVQTLERLASVTIPVLKDIGENRPYLRTVVDKTAIVVQSANYYDRKQDYALIAHRITRWLASNVHWLLFDELTRYLVRYNQEIAREELDAAAVEEALS